MRQFVILLIFLAAPQISSADAASLRFDGTLTLEDVFDSGLRPRLVPGLEKYQCEVAGAEIELDFVTGSFQLAFERTNFRINKEDAVILFQATTAYLTLEEAEKKIREICDAMVQDSDAILGHLAAVEKDPIAAYTPYGIRLVEKDSLIASLGVMAGVNAIGKPVRLVVTARWKRPNSRTDLRTTPITPPEKYADVSMAHYPVGTSGKSDGSQEPRPGGRKKKAPGKPAEKAASTSEVESKNP